MRIELPSETGKLISIEVAKHTSRYGKECPHSRIEIDQTLTTVQCLDCNQSINPVVWLAMLAEEWQRIKRLAGEYNTAVEKLNERSRVKCRHCGKITPVHA